MASSKVKNNNNNNNKKPFMKNNYSFPTTPTYLPGPLRECPDNLAMKPN
jgi:hypothetical protein